MRNPFKLKIIRRDNMIFIIRITLYIFSGSLKCHIILLDDPEKPHSHPWNFKSWLFLGAYREILYTQTEGLFAHTEVVEYNHKMWSIVTRKCEQLHKIQLYKVFGRSIPCVTLGYYTDKKQSWTFKGSKYEYN